MKNEIIVYIISLKNSKRVKKLKARLKKNKIKFKIVEGVNGNNFFKNNRLNKISNEKKLFITLEERCHLQKSEQLLVI